MDNLGDAIGLLIWVTLVPVLIALALRSRHDANDRDKDSHDGRGPDGHA